MPLAPQLTSLYILTQSYQQSIIGESVELHKQLFVWLMTFETKLMFGDHIAVDRDLCIFNTIVSSLWLHLPQDLLKVYLKA